MAEKSASRKGISGSAGATAFPDDWIRDRPHFPSVYGISTSDEGLLPWSHVDQRMRKAMRYWVSSVDGDGRPHATPIDGMWIEGRLFFGGNPATRRNRNLVANPAACVHLEEAMDVVILHGDARELSKVSPELSQSIMQHSKDKYGFAPPVDDLSAGGIFEFEPRLVFAWKDFTKDATRFRRPGAKASGPAARERAPAAAAKTRNAATPARPKSTKGVKSTKASKSKKR